MPPEVVKRRFYYENGEEKWIDTPVDPDDSQESTVPEQTSGASESTASAPTAEQKPSEQIIGGRSYKAVDWSKVIERIETVNDYTLLHDQMSIPPELKKLEDAGFYKYRWLDEKSDRFHEQLDAHIPWEIVNRNNSPEVPDRYFDTSGAIRKGSNLILARMHRKAHDLRQRLIWKASETPTRQGTFKDGMSFEDNPVRGSDIVVAAETESGSFQELNQRAGVDRDTDA